jgi:hypothetical protein
MPGCAGMSRKLDRSLFRLPAGRSEFELREFEAGRNRVADKGPVAKRSHRLPGMSGHDALRSFAAGKIIAKLALRRPDGAAMSSSSGAPACQCQISVASTRCQCKRSPRASRK